MFADIEKRLDQRFEKPLFHAALGNVEDSKNPLRFNNFAYATRELVRHVLLRLAPDDEVLKCSWYAEETGKTHGISRRQRVYYAVQGGLSDEYVRDDLNIDIAEIHSELRDALDRLSKHTHVEESTFNIDESRGKAFVEETLAAVKGLFSIIDENREALVVALREKIDDSTIDAALTETILSIDEIASHHSIEDIYTDTIRVIEINSHSITFEAKGLLSCELQWGSSSDFRRGDGTAISESFPFVCELSSAVCAPDEVQADEDALRVDTSSWWDGYYDEEP